ncbi:TPA: 50S ribosomal protein L23 [Candidatus Woesearchaeota archaeon]|nr:MAG: large subunit ribosomal protein L23 [archaeon GW2011_AR16]HIG96380.1 50S ribosomal protein L23 [Candidatus Woesearchaeota archaeon]
METKTNITPSIIKYPISSEKCIRLMESENKLLFVVDKQASKQDIKKAIEETFKVKVTSVNTYIFDSKKRAYVQFSKEYPAIDVATQLGLM